MGTWTWTPKDFRWHEQLLFSLAFIAWIEASCFYGEMMRGIAIGFAASSLVVMLVNRRFVHVMFCAGLIAMSAMLTPHVGHSRVGFASAQLLAVFMLVVPMSMVWADVRRRGGWGAALRA